MPENLVCKPLFAHAGPLWTVLPLEAPVTMTVLAIFPQVAWFLKGCVVEPGDFYLQPVKLELARHWLAKRGTSGPAFTVAASKNALETLFGHWDM